MDNNSNLDRRIQLLREEVLRLDPKLEGEISKPTIPDILDQQAVDKVLETYRQRPSIIKKHLLVWNLESHGKLDARIIDSQTQRIESETRLYKSATEKEKARQELRDLQRTLTITDREKTIKQLKQELEIEKLKDKMEKFKRSREKIEPEPQREDYEI